jgi:hypothetical protein
VRLCTWYIHVACCTRRGRVYVSSRPASPPTKPTNQPASQHASKQASKQATQPEIIPRVHYRLNPEINPSRLPLSPANQREPPPPQKKGNESCSRKATQGTGTLRQAMTSVSHNTPPAGTNNSISPFPALPASQPASQPACLLPYLYVCMYVCMYGRWTCFPFPVFLILIRSCASRQPR